MSKLIDVNKIDWQEGVFVNPNTKKPLPIIHKMATIEMLRDWQEGVQAIPLDKVKQARKEFISKYPKNYMGEPELGGRTCYFSLNEVLEILDEYFTESEE